ncbi:MAG: hypothetical protein IPI57_12255 [Candidatus Competibacteraceae bacterium]|nr:hypothetical protein [Candidatus Competibacteraceae bacterium]
MSPALLSGFIASSPACRRLIEILDAARDTLLRALLGIAADEVTLSPTGFGFVGKPGFRG